MKLLISLLLCVTFYRTEAQNYFEGEIIYQVEVQKKDSSFDLSNILSYPASTFTFLFKNGVWINAPDSGVIDFGHFRWDENRQYYKFRGEDTLHYYDYSRINPELDSLVSIDHKYNTDTILGRICNRLILKTNKLSLTLAYSPLLAVNPDWFKNTKGGYYDVIYSNIKAIYLMSIVETSQYISKDTAIEITQRELSDKIFNDIHQLPKKAIPLD